MPNAAIFTISDSRALGAAEDLGGPAVEAALVAIGCTIAERRIIPDEIDEIRAAVESFIGRVRLIVTTGGTGVADRDVTPEAIEPLIEKPLPGFGEIMRGGTFAKTPLSVISRGGAGVTGGTLILMLPGSPRGVMDCLELLSPAIKHVLQVLEKQKVDCQAEANRDERR